MAVLAAVPQPSANHESSPASTAASSSTSTSTSTSTATSEYRPIGDYALLSDCHSSALVSSVGSIDWACLRRFDAGSAFARLLDHERGGHFAIVPRGRVLSSSRRYLDATMVLETTLDLASGTVVFTDAFAMEIGGSDDPSNVLVRRVECVAGSVDVEFTISPRFDYGAAHPWLRRHGERIVSAVAGDDALVVQATVAIELSSDTCAVTGSSALSAGESFTITARSQAAHQLDVTPIDDAAALIDATVEWWREWSSSTVAEGPYAALLERSALVLKALCCAPTGAIIAAPTTSLPEIRGGAANWDYRFCWIRDATLTLAALSIVGHREVAQGFRTFVMRSAAGHGDELQIMYGIYGERRLPEIELDLTGWRGASPVRIGNGAAHQTQLDMYGHLLDAVHVWHQENHDLDQDEWVFLASLVEIATQRWNEPDQGIWEIRGAPRHFVHSKVMVWVAIDCGIQLVADHGFDGVDLDVWAAVRDRIRHDVETEGVSSDGGHFVQSFGTDEVDASLLQLVLVGFVDANDPRMIETVRIIQAELASANGFIRRYRSSAAGSARPSEATETVSGDDEGVFLLCTCWLVQVLAMQGRIEEATQLFDRVVAVGNDVGLFAEEYDPTTEEFLGNFPQAFTHLGLIAAADRLRTCSPT